MKKIKNKGLIFLLLMFVGLSYFKLYTTKIHMDNEPTTLIVKREELNFKNGINIADYNDKQQSELSWYHNNEYKVLYSNEIGSITEKAYDFSIIIWWVLLVCIPVYILILLSRRFLKK